MRVCFIFFFLFIFFTVGPASATPLTLEEVLTSTETYSPLILAAKSDQNKAQAEYLAAKGGFDPTVKAAYTNNFGGYYKYNYTDLVLEQPTPLWGAKVFGGWRNGDGTFPIYDAKMTTFTGGEVRGGIEVPLLKGGSIDERRARLKTSEQGMGLYYESLNAQRLELRKQASQKYWDWIAAGRKVSVAKELLQIALNRDEAITRRVKHGDSPQIDQVDNQRSVLQRQAALIAAERALQKAAFELSLYYRDRTGKPLVVSDDSLPTQFPSDHFEKVIQEYESKNLSIQSHPEFKKLAWQSRQLQIENSLARNQNLPKLDFQFGVFSDIGLNPGTSYLPPSAYPTEWRATFSLEFPIFFRSSRGKVKASLASLDRLDAIQNWTRDKLNIQVRDSLQAMKASFQRLKLAHDEIALAQKLEKSERIRAEHGDSSILIVNLREQATRDAMVKEIEAFSDFYKSLAEYEASSGTWVK